MLLINSIKRFINFYFLISLSAGGVTRRNGKTLLVVGQKIAGHPAPLRAKDLINGKWQWAGEMGAWLGAECSVLAVY